MTEKVLEEAESPHGVSVFIINNNKLPFPIYCFIVAKINGFIDGLKKNGLNVELMCSTSIVQSYSYQCVFLCARSVVIIVI